jgi:hypothetical protein
MPAASQVKTAIARSARFAGLPAATLSRSPTGENGSLQLPHRPRPVQIAARDADLGVPCCIPHFGKGSSTGKRVADKRVAPVMDG